MKTIVTGVLAFIIWSAASTYWYVYKIKDFEPTPAEVSIVEPADKPGQAAEPEPATVPEEAAEVPIDNPGIFTFNHEFDRSDFNEESTLSAYMEQMKKYMEQNTDSQIQISGHTDNLGSATYNQSLALKRATSVSTFLTEHGITDDRIQIRALGEREPIADNSTGEGRALNRRTTIEIK